MLFDIHSHILPAVDDGAENLNEALKILKLMQSQGITDVIATPHFYPAVDNLDDFTYATNEALKNLKEFSVKRNLPNIYLGCELLYFNGISKSEALSQFCLNNSEYLLLELSDNCINDILFDDIININQRFGIIPIIAHIERYSGDRRYKKLIKFLKANKIPVQINAASVLSPALENVIKKLLYSGLECVIATDSHSTDLRPPYLAQALEHISAKYGKEKCAELISVSQKLYKKTVCGGD